VVLRLRRHVLSGIVRTAAGVVLATVPPAGPGLLELYVPAFGTFTLEL
jgi:hypothetical protein